MQTLEEIMSIVHADSATPAQACSTKPLHDCVEEHPAIHHAHANFKRKEKKYVLEAGDYLALMALIGDKIEEDEYPYSHIESLYYDTPDWRMINRSMEKPLYKEKLRVRVYGETGEQNVAFVELKKKFKGIVYKRRIAMSPQGARAFMEGMVSGPPADAV